MRTIKKITVSLIIVLLFGIFFIPRNNSPNDFAALKKGDNFVLTMLRLGKPTNVSRGGINIIYFEYKLSDDSSVYLTFQNWHTSLDTCIRYKDNEVLNRYITKF